MKLTQVLLMLLVACFALPAVRAQQRVRKEVRDMTNEEWTTYTDAILTLKERGDWNRLAIFHGDLFSTNIHRDAQFLPWHRMFLLELEELLNEVAPPNSSIAVPYWDWTLDARNPNNSPVFRGDRFGGFSRRNGECITTGPFTSFQPCIQRNNRYRGPGFDSVDVVEAYGGAQGSSEFEVMRNGVEGLHNLVHVGVGGWMNSQYSPYDPIFYSHHAFIDKIWAEWQELHPDNVRAYPIGREGETLQGYPGVQVSDMFESSEFARGEGSAQKYEFAAFAQGGSDSWTASTRSSLFKLPLSVISQIPRTCPAPEKPENATIWSESSDVALEQSQARVNLDLASADDTCMDQQSIEEALRSLDQGNDSESEFPEFLIASIAVGCCLAIIVAVVIVNRRRSKNATEEQPAEMQPYVSTGHYLQPTNSRNIPL